MSEQNNEQVAKKVFDSSLKETDADKAEEDFSDEEEDEIDHDHDIDDREMALMAMHNMNATVKNMMEKAIYF